MVANNVRRNSTNNVPSITIVDSGESKRRNCCVCIPETVGVFSILSLYFFLGVFYAAGSFVSLGFAGNVLDIVIASISGSLHAILAITSAFGVSAIRMENIHMMRRLSIVFWVLTVLLLFLNITSLVLEFMTKAKTIQDCQNAVNEKFGNNANSYVVDCNNYVNDTLISDSIRTFILGTTSIYFAYVIRRYTRQMKETTFTLADGQKTPTYFAYNQHPPTSNNWVPPPTYTVRASNPLPDGFNPDSKQAPV